MADPASVFDLTPAERLVVAAIYSSATPLTSNELAYALYGDDPECGTEGACGTVRVLLHKAKKKLARAGWVIESGGYRIKRAGVFNTIHRSHTILTG